MDRRASLSCHDFATIFPSGGPSVMATGGGGEKETEGRRGRIRAEIVNHNSNADTTRSLASN